MFPRGLTVFELQSADLTPQERLAFGLSSVLPVEGLEQHNVDLVPSRSALYPFEDVQYERTH